MICSRFLLLGSFLMLAVFTAQTIEARDVSPIKERRLGVCSPIAYNKPSESHHPEDLSPAYLASGYFSAYEGGIINNHIYDQLSGPPIRSIEIVRQPKHGKVVRGTYEDDSPKVQYVPTPGYVGNDRVTFLVNVDGLPVRVVYFLKVTKLFTDSPYVTDALCGKRTNWKISPPDDPRATRSKPERFLERDDPLLLTALSPTRTYSLWWAEDKDSAPTNHFPAFRTAETTYALQYCRFDSSFVHLACSAAVDGSADVTYKRATYNKRLAKQIKAETYGAMSVVYFFDCAIRCSESVPKKFALMLYDGGD